MAASGSDFNAELVVPSNTNCTIVPTTAGGLSYPTSPNGYPMDPIFKGLRCDIGADCLSGVCDAGFCRCTNDAKCTSGGTGSGQNTECVEGNNAATIPGVYCQVVG